MSASHVSIDIEPPTDTKEQLSIVVEPPTDTKAQPKKKHSDRYTFVAQVDGGWQLSIGVIAACNHPRIKDGAGFVHTFTLMPATTTATGVGE